MEIYKQKNPHYKSGWMTSYLCINPGKC